MNFSTADSATLRRIPRMLRQLPLDVSDAELHERLEMLLELKSKLAEDQVELVAAMFESERLHETATHGATDRLALRVALASRRSRRASPLERQARRLIVAALIVAAFTIES